MSNYWDNQKVLREKEQIYAYKVRLNKIQAHEREEKEQLEHYEKQFTDDERTVRDRLRSQQDAKREKSRQRNAAIKSKFLGYASSLSAMAKTELIKSLKKSRTRSVPRYSRSRRSRARRRK